MKVYETWPSRDALQGIAHLCLGFFDGLHLGHTAVIQQAMETSSGTVGVFTFHNHPMTVIRPTEAPQQITGFPHKLRILREWGVPVVIAPPFDTEHSKMAYGDFLHMLQDRFPSLKGVSAGFNWKFGYRRLGTPEILTAWAHANHLKCEITNPVQHNGQPISSTRIRTEIKTGNIASAQAMLGRPFSLLGTVAHGKEIGRTIGFPTANLQTLDECLPPRGVYAGTAILSDGSKWKCAVNIGSAPTVNSSQQSTIEAHLIDFSGNLYDSEILLEFKHFLRPEKKFPDIDALKKAIAADVQSAAIEN